MSNIPKPEAIVALTLLRLLLLPLKFLFHLFLPLLVLLYLLPLLLMEVLCARLGAEAHCELLRLLPSRCNRRNWYHDSVRR